METYRLTSTPALAMPTTNEAVAGSNEENTRPSISTLSAMNKFKAMDEVNNPKGMGKPNFVTTNRTGRGNPKQALLDWCAAVTKGYEGVDVKNFGRSWADGLAFCAMVHHFYPDAFDFSELKATNRRANFELAFEKAEKLGNIAPLLEVEDMMRMEVPDWKCVFTQIQLYFRRLHLEQGKNAHVQPTGMFPLAGPPKAESSQSNSGTTEDQ